MAHIHIFSGLASSIFPSLRRDTEALDRMIDKLSANFDSEHHIWDDWPTIAKELLLKAARKELTGPIILIGHSNGVIACTEIARRLNTLGIKVDYIAGIDPTAGSFPPLGENVVLADDFHAASGFPAIARALSGGRRGALQKGPGFHGELNVFKIGGGHVPAPGNPFVIGAIMAQVKRLTGAQA